MKTAYVVIAMMLVASIFATGVAVAERGRDSGSIMPYPDDSVRRTGDSSTSRGGSGGGNSIGVLDRAGSVETELSGDTDASAEVEVGDSVLTDEAPEKWRAYPAVAFYGQGYGISSASQGAFVRLTGVQKSFVNPASETEAKTFTRMLLKVGTDTYNLKRTIDATSDDLNKALTFDAFAKGKKVGSATFSIKQSLNGNFKIREGKLNLDDGTVWTIVVATNLRNVEKKTAETKPEDSRTGAKKTEDSSTRNSDYAAKKQKAYEAFQAEQKQQGKNPELNSEDSNRAWAKFWNKIFGRSGSNSGSG